MLNADLDPPSQAALTAYVDALYDGASELVALYAAVTAWLSHHPGMLVDEAREMIKSLLVAPPAQNVVRLRG
ncbi:MAG TPA: hypothetical protein VF342_13305 [Alphaproteobacteria bacterium]